MEQCDSTNDLAKGLGDSGMPHGTWISAKRQTMGRGRLGRAWTSLDGNLFLSIVIRDVPQGVWSWVPLTTAIALVSYFRTLLPEVNFQVKWPNDLWLGGAKLGGILCEGASSKTGAYIVVGIGVNCQHSPELLDQAVTDLSVAAATSGRPRGFSADEIRLEIIARVLMELKELATLGPQSIQERYTQWAVFPEGSFVEWGVGQMGIVMGLGPSGELRVQKVDPSMKASGLAIAEVVSLLAEDVRGLRKTGLPRH